jgi:hypothetical protein
MTVAATALAGGTQTATAAVTGFYTDPSATNDRASAAVSVAMPPTATTGDATSLTSSSAHLGGTVNPGLATVNDCHFEYGTTTAYGSSVPCAASPGSGGDPVRVSAAVTGLSPGTTYHFRLVATNALGSTHGADASFATPAAVIPVLSRLKLSRKRFHAASRGQSIAAGATRVGTTVTYTDSLPATTRFVVIRKVAGVRRGARCVAPHGRLRKHVRRCTRRVSAGSFTHADAAGPNRFRFTGRVAHKRLRPGKYLLSASASSPAGASAPVSARFTIAR